MVQKILAETELHVHLDQQVGDVAQLVRASDRHAADAGSIPWVRQGIFFSESTFSADSFGVRTPPCATICINICAHVKDPVLHVRVLRIKATQTQSTQHAP